jgi:hypothetical protein
MKRSKHGLELLAFAGAGGAVQVMNMGQAFSVAVLAAVISIGIPGNLSAQGRGGMPARTGAGMGAAPHAAAMPSGMAGARVGAGALGHVMISRSASGQVMRRGVGTSGVRTYRTRVGTAVTRGGQLSAARRRVISRGAESVPGLGFDYSHIAATRPGGVNGRHRNRNGRNDGAVLFPFFGGGGYFVPTGSDLIGDYGSEGQVAQDAEEEDGPAPVERPARTYTVDRLPLGPPAPQRDVPEYIFVRRDGTVFFAVAYTWESGSLRYVSSEGLSRSVARETLDLNATQQFNEQRGMAFRSPA